MSVINGGKIACSVLNSNYVTMIYEGKIACSALKVNYVIGIYRGWGDSMCSFESELYPSDLWGNSMFSFEFELCHSNLWEEMAYSLLCLDRLDRKF